MNPIFPSVLASDFFNLAERLQEFRDGGVQVVHLDIMDGHFVNNISFGPNMARAIRARFPFQLDAHLMVDNPQKTIPWFLDAGCEWISFHFEAGDEIAVRQLLRFIRTHNRRAGLVLNPDTPPEHVFSLLADADYLLLMSVFPGLGGQTFIPATLPKLRSLRTEIDRQRVACLLQVDGGIRADNIAAIHKAGADLFVIGTSLFNAAAVPATLRHLYQLIPWSPT